MYVSGHAGESPPGFKCQTRSTRWANDPPPGFTPDGESIMVDSVDDLPPPPKIKGPDGKLYTPEEWGKEREDSDDDQRRTE